MFRALFTIVLPLILPTVIYLLYMYLTRPKVTAAAPAPAMEGAEGEAEGEATDTVSTATSPPERPIPWLLLSALGVVLAGAVAIALSLFDGYDKGMVYIPAHMGADGTIVPARTVPADQVPQKPKP